jgi:hypothetical protein
MKDFDSINQFFHDNALLFYIARPGGSPRGAGLFFRQKATGTQLLLKASIRQQRLRKPVLQRSKAKQTWKLQPTPRAEQYYRQRLKV